MPYSALTLLDRCADEALDDLVWLASRICDTPIALLSLTDGQREWIRASVGLPAQAQSVGRGDAFCVHMLDDAEVLEVEDARADERFSRNPFVVGPPGVRFYAGVPFHAPGGQRIGALCVVDAQVRRLGASQREGLQRLARRAADQLHTRQRSNVAQARERTLERLLDAMPDAVVTCDVDGKLEIFNEVARDWHGVDPRPLPATEWAAHFHLHDSHSDELMPMDQIPLQRAWRGERVREVALVVRAPGRPPRTVLCNADPHGAILGAVCVMHDVTGRLLAEDRLRESERRLRTVADAMPALIAHVGADLRYQFVNKPYAAWLGLLAQNLVGRHMSEVLRQDHYAGLLPRLQKVFAGETLTFDIDVVQEGLGTRHMHATYVPDGPAQKDIHGRWQCAGFHLMVHDLTEKTQLARMLQERALTDELTGLPNRAAWNGELPRGAARAHRAGRPVTVMFMDLDGLKRVNDTYGHAAGDAFLCEFAHRVRGCLQRSDFVARLGGDEFVVLLDHVAQPCVDPSAIATKLLAKMQTPLHFEGHLLDLTASIGIAVQHGREPDLAHLMQVADEAMYLAKRSTRVKFLVVAC